MRRRSEPMPVLLDREAERATLDTLLTDLRSGRGRALVVRGEPGVGKSALLEYVAGAAADMRVIRAAGVESEMELAFASLHQLCVPLRAAQALPPETCAPPARPRTCWPNGPERGAPRKGGECRRGAARC
jgi:AAA ATPase domain